MVRASLFYAVEIVRLDSPAPHVVAVAIVKARRRNPPGFVLPANGLLSLLRICRPPWRFERDVPPTKVVLAPAFGVQVPGCSSEPAPGTACFTERGDQVARLHRDEHKPG